MKKVLRIVTVAVVACALLNGCSTTQEFRSGQFAVLDSVVRVGDWVECTMRDGSHRKFKVEQIAPGRISGQLGSAAAGEITEIRVSRFDGKKTAWVVGGVVAVGVAALATAASHAPDLNFGPNGPAQAAGK